MHARTHARDGLGAWTFGSAGLPVMADATCLAQSSSSLFCRSFASAGGTGRPDSSSTAPARGLFAGNIALASALASASCVDFRRLSKHGSSI